MKGWMSYSRGTNVIIILYNIDNIAMFIFHRQNISFNYSNNTIRNVNCHENHIYIVFKMWKIQIHDHGELCCLTWFVFWPRIFFVILNDSYKSASKFISVVFVVKLLSEISLKFPRKKRLFIIFIMRYNANFAELNWMFSLLDDFDDCKSYIMERKIEVEETIYSVHMSMINIVNIKIEETKYIGNNRQQRSFIYQW